MKKGAGDGGRRREEKMEKDKLIGVRGDKSQTA